MIANLAQRLVGETWADYASRMAGWARAAEMDRDAALARVAELERNCRCRITADGRPIAPSSTGTGSPPDESSDRA